MRTFFQSSSMASMRERFQKDGAQDFKDVLKAYKPMGVQGMKDKSQTLIQGGLVCFDGTKETFFHKDEGTGAHADFGKALASLSL
mmetsp:Transcript_35070/g.75998  ORF Transcript_35070/g.75998 Transcript_35070/m.75998 type:complete len:85 (+) Transcript_35070:608-862(+)